MTAASHVLITGGAGFIGSSLAVRLLDQGHRVRVLSLVKTRHDAANAERLRGLGAEFIEGDVADGAVQDAAMEGVDVVHHIAATMREADVPTRVFWETNVEATRHLLERSRERGVARFVYCSSIGVVGAIRGRRIDESEPYRFKDIYGRTKAAAEELVLDEARRTGVPATAVRPADVYGPGDVRLQKLFRMIQRGRFFYLGSGRGRRHMIYIDDLVDGMLAAQERPTAVGEAFFLAGPSPIALRDLVALIARELGVAAPRVRLPYRPVWLLSAAVELACRPLGVQPPIYPRRVDFYAHDYEYDTTKARGMLGFEPKIDVREGIRRTIESYRSQGVLS